MSVEPVMKNIKPEVIFPTLRLPAVLLPEVYSWAFNWWGPPWSKELLQSIQPQQPTCSYQVGQTVPWIPCLCPRCLLWMLCHTPTGPHSAFLDFLVVLITGIARLLLGWETLGLDTLISPMPVSWRRKSTDYGNGKARYEFLILPLTCCQIQLMKCKNSHVKYWNNQCCLIGLL